MKITFHLLQFLDTKMAGNSITLMSHECHSVRNHCHLYCLFNSFFGLTPRNSKHCITGPVSRESTSNWCFPINRASDVANGSWRYQGYLFLLYTIKELFNLHSQYQHYWKPVDMRSQGITNYCYDLGPDSYQCRKSHCGDYKNPLHLDVVDRYLRRRGDKTIPGEAPPSLESFYPPWVAGIDLPQSRCCGFLVSFTNEHI